MSYNEVQLKPSEIIMITINFYPENNTLEINSYNDGEEDTITIRGFVGGIIGNEDMVTTVMNKETQKNLLKKLAEEL